MDGDRHRTPARRRAPAAALLVCAGAALAAGCKAPPLPEAEVETTTISDVVDWDVYSLGSGDVVRVVVFDHPEFSTPPEGELIDFQGCLSLPLLGPVELGGLTTAAARLRVEERLAEYLRDPAVSLSVVEYGARRVYVLGEVTHAGSYPLDRPMNALQALSLSGGFKPNADRENVALMRTSTGELEVHVFDGATPGRDGMVAIQPDDVLFVRLSGTGSFREAVLPYLQGMTPVIGSLTNLLVIADALEDD